MEPEKLSLWDRIFNRYRRVIISQGSETWSKRNQLGQVIQNSNFTRDYVTYKVIDRVTGSETIERVYLT